MTYVSSTPPLRRASQKAEQAQIIVVQSPVEIGNRHKNKSKQRPYVIGAIDRMEVKLELENPSALEPDRNKTYKSAGAIGTGPLSSLSSQAPLSLKGGKVKG